ncbi:formyl transferase [Bowmanella dokdonensis]|uniref:Formyl transferase n=1 Tax=Bowmanella dokdonensis TaxID=751969 RepID=A0A939DM29_9ALTE|nr:formyl transferase [Bowmanella dokdonensis]MBN7824635.1 formyl transferase [Bowmanella dokdonensis]
MNILILANRDLASNVALNLLLPNLAQHSLSLMLSSRVGGAPSPLAGMRRLKFFEQDLPNRLLFPHLPAPETRPGKYLSFGQMHRHLAGPAEDLNDINTEQGVEKVRALAPDLILSIRYGVILKEAVIALPRFGVVNLHSGLLPAYRGVMASFWAMLNGEPQLGTTCHYIQDPAIDAGDIISCTYLPVDREKCYLLHVLELYREGCQELLKVVDMLATGTCPVTRPQSGKGQYFSFPDQQALDRFAAGTLQLVDEQQMLDFLQQHYY